MLQHSVSPTRAELNSVDGALFAPLQVADSEESIVELKRKHAQIQERNHNIALTCAFFLVVIGASNNVVGQIRANLLGGQHNAPVVLLTNNFAYPIVFWLILLVLLRRNDISKAELEYVWHWGGAWRILAFCGFCDVCNALLTFLAQPHLPVILCATLNQTNLLFVAFWSYLIFGRKYILLECIGIALTAIGSYVAVYGASLSWYKSYSLDETIGEALGFSQSSRISIPNVIQLLASCAFGGLSNVEEKFGEQNFRVLSEMRILGKIKVAILDFVG